MDKYKEVIYYVKKYFEKNDPDYNGASGKYSFRDRFEHTLRVCRWALRINKVEQGDEEIVAISALFHDTGKPVKSDNPHAEESMKICDKYLKNNRYPKKKRARILQAVRNHSYKEGHDKELAHEDSILIDADLMDEAGALAVLWDSMATAAEPDASYYKAYQRHLKYSQVLAHQRKYFKTGYGRQLFDERLAFLNDFIKNLEYELGIEEGSNRD